MKEEAEIVPGIAFSACKGAEISRSDLQQNHELANDNSLDHPDRAGLTGKKPRTKREIPRVCSSTAAIVHVANLVHDRADISRHADQSGRANMVFVEVL